MLRVPLELLCSTRWHHQEKRASTMILAQRASEESGGVVALRTRLDLSDLLSSYPDRPIHGNAGASKERRQ
jgi:hypothetical protein